MGASQQLLSELPWEKKNQISLQKARNSKIHDEGVKLFLAFISRRTAWAETSPSLFTLSPWVERRGWESTWCSPGLVSSVAMCKSRPQWGMSQAPGPAGQCIRGFLNTNPNLRPTPTHPWGWRAVRALGSSARNTGGWHSPHRSIGTSARSKWWG